MDNSCSSGKRKQRRKKSKASKEQPYDVPEHVCDCIDIKAVEKSSGASLDTRTSSKPGLKTFVIRGTRAQIRKALDYITTCTGEKDKCLTQAQVCWLDWVKEAFPNFEIRTYFLPPAYIRRVPVTETTVHGLNLLVLGTNNATCNVQMSDIVEDEALQRVLFSFKALSKIRKEVFMCLSQFPFGSYLGEPCFAPAVAHLPSPTSLPEKYPWSWRQGDFDVLIIHMQYGYVICEVKGVGYTDETRQEEQTEAVVKKLNEAAKQLDKEENMLLHLVSDINIAPRITKTIACPNLQTSQVEAIISQNEQLAQTLCQCLKVTSPANVSRRILCSDQLKNVGDNVTEALEKWWQETVAVSGPDTQLNSNQYRTLISRFCGPASTVRVPCISEPRVCIKTMEQLVAHVGDCYSAFMTLYPEQISLLIRPPLRVFISGPPGTGKTTMLLLMALKWLRHGNTVYVLSTWDRSLAATSMLFYLLEKELTLQKQDPYPDNNTNEDTEKIKVGRIIHIKRNFRRKEDIKETLTELEQVAKQGPLYIIADEVGPDLLSEHYFFAKFCASLLDLLGELSDHLHFWAASCQDNVAPIKFDIEESDLGWEVVHFTRPLRSPPAVLEEVKKAVEITRDYSVREYSERKVPDHADGPPIKWFYHQAQSTRVEDCSSCGKKVEKFLHKKLRLGRQAASSDDPLQQKTAGSTVSGCKFLRNKDVLILSWVELKDDAPIVKALLNAKIPVRVMKDSDIEDVATASSDVVWVARQQLVSGLKRKVVVILNNYDDSKGEYVSTRLRAMSRCTSQLVVVCPPPGYEPKQSD